MLLTQSIADLSLLIYIGDDLGLPVEDLDASDLTTIHFVPARGSEVAISLTDLSDAAADAHLDGGIIHRRNGYYRLDVPGSVGASVIASGALVFEATDTRLIGASIQVVAALPAELTQGPGVNTALSARVDAVDDSNISLLIAGLTGVTASDSLDGSVDDATTTFQVTTGSRFGVGDMVRAVGSAELVRVTAVTGDDLIVQRGMYGTTPEAIADGVTLLIVGRRRATLDGETVTTDASSREASKADVSALALEATVLQIAAKTDNLDDKLTSDRAAKLDRDLAHADDADTYKADVTELASDADMQTLLTRTAQGVSVTIGSHMASDGQTLHIVQGEAYLSAISNAIQVQITDDRLTSAITSDGTIAMLRIRPPVNCHGSRLTLTGQVTDFDDEAKVVTLVFEMTKHQSAGLTPGDNIYEIDLVLQGNDAYVLTPVIGATLKVARHIA